MGILSALTRRRLLGGAGALSLLPAAAPGRAGLAGVPPAPRSEEHVLDLVAFVEPTGGEWQPILHGRFRGTRLSGDVLPGGILRFAMREDGVCVVETSCTLRTLDGSHVPFSARALGHPGAADASSLRAVPDFEAPPGVHDWLNRALVVGSLDVARRAEGRVSFRIHRIG